MQRRVRCELGIPGGCHRGCPGARAVPVALPTPPARSATRSSGRRRRCDLAPARGPSGNPAVGTPAAAGSATARR